MSLEHNIQNQIRNALALPGIFTARANVGQAWTGDDIKKLPDGSLLIRNPRPFSTGLPTGFSDTFGVVSETVTQQMVGATIGRPFFIEVKQPGKGPTEIQGKFLAAMQRLGARAGVARCVDDALRIAGIKT